MTRDQLHIAFKIEMDKNATSIAFGSYPAFLPAEIDYWLDKAMYQVVSNKFTGNNALKQPFEKSVKRIHDLETLIVTEHLYADDQKIGDTEILDPNSNYATFTDAFKNKLFYVSCVLVFNKDNKTNVNLIEHDNAKNFIQTYNNIPWIEEPVAVIEGNDLIIYYDPISMKSNKYEIDLTCVKKPVVTEFTDNVSYEIISRAVLLALENIESNRSQTKSQLNQIDE